MRYFLFIDETGEANINKPDPRIDIFVLCGILFREDAYQIFDEHLKSVKRKIWGNEDIVFHSYHMRKQEGAFQIFQDKARLTSFYKEIGDVFTTNEYTVFSCIIHKSKYKLQYPEKNFAYEESLMFMCERSIKCVLNSGKENSLHICLEKRQPGKDRLVMKYYNNFVRYGTEFVSTADFRICNPLLHFRGKNENINGLQFADLCAYPIARTILAPDIPQPTYDLFKDKIHCGYYGNQKGYGLKHFP